MRYAQTQLTEDEFIMVKTAAIRAKVSLSDFLKMAAIEKSFLDGCKNWVEEKQESSTNKP